MRHLFKTFALGFYKQGREDWKCNGRAELPDKKWSVSHLRGISFHLYLSVGANGKKKKILTLSASIFCLIEITN